MKFSWSVHHDLGGSFVIEHEDGYPTVTYGPMPASLVSAFVCERQASVRHVFERILNRETPNG